MLSMACRNNGLRDLGGSLGNQRRARRGSELRALAQRLGPEMGDAIKTEFSSLCAAGAGSILNFPKSVSWAICAGRFCPFNRSAQLVYRDTIPNPPSRNR